MQNIIFDTENVWLYGTSKHSPSPFVDAGYETESDDDY